MFWNEPYRTATTPPKAAFINGIGQKVETLLADYYSGTMNHIVIEDHAGDDKSDLEFLQMKRLVTALLDTDNLLLKARAGDPRLLQLLRSQPKILLTHLFRHVVGATEEANVNNTTDLDRQQSGYKWPSIASELLLCEPLDICEFVKKDFSLLDPLWQFLETNHQDVVPARPSSRIHKMFAARVLAHLLTRIPKELLDGLCNRSVDNPPLDPLLSNLTSPPIAELLLKIVILDETHADLHVLSWLADARLMHELAGLLAPQHSQAIHEAVVSFIFSIFSVGVTERFSFDRLFSPLLSNGSLLDSILDNALSEDMSGARPALVATVDVLTKIVEQTCRVRNEHPKQPLPSLSLLAEKLEKRICRFDAILDQPNIIVSDLNNGKLQTNGPLGIERLKTAQLFAMLPILLEQDNGGALSAAVCEASVPSRMLNLMFAFPHNNFLHTHIVDFFTRILSLDARDVAVEVFRKARICGRIVEAQRRQDALMETRRAPRLGYMGHIYLLADAVTAYADQAIQRGEEDGELFEAIRSATHAEQWQEYLQTSFASQKSLRFCQLGGEPAPPQPPLDAEEEAEHASTMAISNRISMFTTGFSSATEERLARFVCGQVVAGLPLNFEFSFPSEDFDDELRDHDVDVDATGDNGEADGHDDDHEEASIGIGIPLGVTIDDPLFISDLPSSGLTDDDSYNEDDAMDSGSSNDDMDIDFTTDEEDGGHGAKKCSSTAEWIAQFSNAYPENNTNSTSRRSLSTSSNSLSPTTSEHTAIDF